MKDKSKKHFPGDSLEPDGGGDVTEESFDDDKVTDGKIVKPGSILTGGDGRIVSTGLRGYLKQIFGTRAFLKLWLAQIVSATGDWLGLFATITLAARLSEGFEGAAIALVLASRVVPGFFLATAVGVLIDRLSRKRVMITCDLGRAVVLLVLPFVDSLIGLVVASFVLELLTLMWQPAKEACMPHLVPRNKLTTANSLNFVAAYGTFPVAAGMASALSLIAKDLVAKPAITDSRFLSSLLKEEGLAFVVDAGSFMVAASIIFLIGIPKENIRKQQISRSKQGLKIWDPFRELREGWKLVVFDPIVRAVNVGLAVGLMGGGLLVPLGPIFVDKIIVSSPGSFLDLSQNLNVVSAELSEKFSLVLLALGIGMAIGVVFMSVMESRITRLWLSHSGIFVTSLVGAGLSLLVAVSVDKIVQVLPFIMLFGLLAGPVYVIGFTLLHTNVADAIRGRVFAALFVLIRLCLLIAFAVAPLLSDLLDRLSAVWWEDSGLMLFGLNMYVPGVRLTLWLAAFVIMIAGGLSWLSFRSGRRQQRHSSA